MELVHCQCFPHAPCFHAIILGQQSWHCIEASNSEAQGFPRSSGAPSLGALQCCPGRGQNHNSIREQAATCLDDDRDAVQGPARLAGSSLLVQHCSALFQQIDRCCLDHGMKSVIMPLDLSQVLLDKTLTRDIAAFQQDVETFCVDREHVHRHVAVGCCHGAVLGWRQHVPCSSSQGWRNVRAGKRGERALLW